MEREAGGGDEEVGRWSDPAAFPPDLLRIIRVISTWSES